MMSLVRYLPRKVLSYWVGRFVCWRGPWLWRLVSIWIFARIFEIECEEAEKPWHEYLSIGDFFCRRLKRGVRSIGDGAVVHPADSVIVQCGDIANGQLIQAKGMDYSVLELTGDKDALQKWDQGFFMTYYLCPTDYHRVHSPMAGEIKTVRHIPGDLFPVNSWSASHIKNLFSHNERVVLEIATDYGPVALVMVGATNVGSIVIHADPNLITNGRPQKSEVSVSLLHGPKPVAKGEELGMFCMGSTVVMIYPSVLKKEMDLKSSRLLNRKVYVGSSV